MTSELCRVRPRRNMRAIAVELEMDFMVINWDILSRGKLNSMPMIYYGENSFLLSEQMHRTIVPSGRKLSFYKVSFCKHHNCYGIKWKTCFGKMLIRKLIFKRIILVKVRFDSVWKWMKRVLRSDALHL